MRIGLFGRGDFLGLDENMAVFFWYRRRLLVKAYEIQDSQFGSLFTCAGSLVGQLVLHLYQVKDFRLSIAVKTTCSLTTNVEKLQGFET